MAWGSLNTLGSSQEKVDDTSLTLAITAAAEANNVIVVLVAFNNVGTVDGDNAAISSVTAPGAGNTFTKTLEFENAQGAAAAGAGISVWVLKVVTTIAINDLITVTFAANNAAKAMTAWEFSIGAGNVVTVQTSTTLANDGADPGSMNLTPPNAEFLWVRGIAKEGIQGTFTKTVAYSNEFGQNGTSGGGAATNMSVVGEHDILTGTTNASDPTWLVSASDHASILVALKEGVSTASPVIEFRVLDYE